MISVYNQFEIFVIGRWLFDALPCSTYLVLGSRLTRISMSIVVVFVCCHLPRFIPNLIEMVLDKPPEVSYYTYLSGPVGGRHSTEVVFTLLTQQPQVWFLCQLVKNRIQSSRRTCHSKYVWCQRTRERLKNLSGPIGTISVPLNGSGGVGVCGGDIGFISGDVF